MARPLSNGTLALKFMQRKALASDDNARVELTKAKVVDEAEWDIGREIREAWGLANEQSSSSSTTPTVVYEASYMPFLKASPSKKRSNRDDSEEQEMTKSVSWTSGRWNNMPKPPPEIEPSSEEVVSASAAKEGNEVIRRDDHPKPSDAGKGKRKLEQDEFDIDPPPAKPSSPLSSKPAPLAFMRPAGVDLPNKPTGTMGDGLPPKKKKKKKSKTTKDGSDSRLENRRSLYEEPAPEMSDISEWYKALTRAANAPFPNFSPPTL
ncbi:hypothetical protein FRB99_001755 [Tulasnella sp. 403]|nr:hypothetical protein FRB99_001755 [Tulasnella sp. 403]